MDRRSQFSDEYLLLRVTEKAILISPVEDLDEAEQAPKFWIPRSQITDCSLNLDDASAGDRVEITIPSWLARDKGLIN